MHARATDLHADGGPPIVGGAKHRIDGALPLALLLQRQRPLLLLCRQCL